MSEISAIIRLGLRTKRCVVRQCYIEYGEYNYSAVVDEVDRLLIDEVLTCYY